MKCWYLVLGLLLCALPSSSNSLGKPKGMCSARDPSLGCSFWNRNGYGKLDFQDCARGNHNSIMYWTHKPRHAPELFTLEAQDGACEYVPGEYISLKLTQHDPNVLYRGFMLYAVNDTDREVKVGSWHIPLGGGIKKFWTPWVNEVGHDCGPVLMHTSAEVKDLVEILRFRAPPAGTGTITLRCLLKTGVANTGEFYWPNSEDLVLREAPVQAQKWILGSAGQSCSAACHASGRVCHGSRLDLRGDRFIAAIDGVRECRLPLLSSCKDATPLQVDQKEYCFYRASNCKNRTTKEACSAFPAKGERRLCACKGGIVRDGVKAKAEASASGTCAANLWIGYKNDKIRPACCYQKTAPPGIPSGSACKEMLLGNTDAFAGAAYEGCQHKTVSGKTCQKWTSQKPHRHHWAPTNVRGKGLGHHNYCRNPDGSVSIWCYTSDPNMRWDFCEPKFKKQRADVLLSIGARRKRQTCSVKGYCSSGCNMRSTRGPVGPYKENKGVWTNTAGCIDTLHITPGCSMEVATAAQGAGTRYTFDSSTCMHGSGKPGYDKVRSIRVFRTKQPTPITTTGASTGPSKDGCWAKGYVSSGCSVTNFRGPVGPYLERNGEWVDTNIGIDRMELKKGCTMEIALGVKGRGKKYTFSEQFVCMRGDGKPGYDKVRSICVFTTPTTTLAPVLPGVEANYIGYHGGCRTATQMSPPLLRVVQGVQSMMMCRHLCLTTKNCAALEYCTPAHIGTCRGICRLLPGPVSQYTWGNGQKGFACYLRAEHPKIDSIDARFSEHSYSYTHRWWLTGPNFHPKNCTDGNLSTWCNLQDLTRRVQSRNKWLMVDLGSPKMVSQVHIIPHVLNDGHTDNAFKFQNLWPSFEIWVGEVANDPWKNKKCFEGQYPHLPFPYQPTQLQSVTEQDDATYDAFVNCRGAGRYVFLLLPGYRMSLRLKEIIVHGLSAPVTCDSFDVLTGCGGKKGGKRCLNLHPEGWGKKRQWFIKKAGAFMNGATMTGDAGGPLQCADGYVASGAALSCTKARSAAVASGQICVKCKMEEWNPIDAARSMSWEKGKFGTGHRFPHLEGFFYRRWPTIGGTCSLLDTCAGVVLTQDIAVRDGFHWFQLDAGVTAPIGGVVVQRGINYDWVSEFVVLTSVDGKKWDEAVMAGGKKQIVIPESAMRKVENKFRAMFLKPIFSRYVRLAKLRFTGKDSRKRGVGRFGLISCRASRAWKQIARDSNKTCTEDNGNLIKVDWTVNQMPYNKLDHCKQLCINNPSCRAFFLPQPKQRIRIDQAGKDIVGCFMFRVCDLDVDSTQRDNGDASVFTRKPWVWQGDTYELQDAATAPLQLLQTGSVAQQEQTHATKRLASNVPSAERSFAASHSTTPLLLAFLAYLVVPGAASWSSTLFIGLSLALPCQVFAHNWFTSPARRTGSASTIAPCLPRTSPVPHVVVRPGQQFVAEWSTGHGGPVYLTVVRSEDEDKVGTGDFGRIMREEYLQEAEQSGAPSLIPKLGMMGHHGQAIPGVLKPKLLLRNQTRWGERPGPPQFSMHGAFKEFREYEEKFLERFMANEKTKIKRYAFKSKRYPALVQVHRFPITYHRALDVDVTSMAIDEPGDYVIQNVWNGYYDCMDVRVVPAKKDMPYPYGQLNSKVQGKLTRIDHCQFVEQSNSDFCTAAFPDPNYCLSACDRSMKGHYGHGRFHSEVTAGCYGVNVVPYKLMKEARFSGSLNLPAACSYLLQPSNPFKLGDDSMICYGVNPRLRTSTQLEYEVSHDPRSSVFYSTCYERRQAIDFAGLPDPGFQPSTQFLFGDKCISCNNVATNMLSGVPATDMVRGHVTVAPGAMTPVWKLEDECQDCEEIPGTPEPTPHSTARKTWGAGHKLVTCTGLDLDLDLGESTGRGKSSTCQNTTCVKFMTTPGSETTDGGVPVAFNLDHCKALAARDSECNDALVYFLGDYSVIRAAPYRHYHHGSRTHDFKEGHVCVCVKKTACCSGCQPRVTDQWSGSNQQPYFYSRTTKHFFAYNGRCRQKGDTPDGKQVGPVSHPQDLGQEGCKEACERIKDCNRAVYDTKQRTCTTYKVEALPDQCDRSRQFWTYWKQWQFTKAQRSFMEVSAEETMSHVADSMEDDATNETALHELDAVDSVPDDHGGEYQHHDDLMCDGAQFPEYTRFAVDYLLEIGYDWANISQILPGSLGYNFAEDTEDKTHTVFEPSSALLGRRTKRHEQAVPVTRQRRRRGAIRRRRWSRWPRVRVRRRRNYRRPSPTKSPTRTSAKASTNAPTMAPTKAPATTTDNAPAITSTRVAKTTTNPPARDRRRRRGPNPPVGGACTNKHSLKTCSPCLTTAQCADGVCDPIMKKCVRSRGQICPEPFAHCYPPCKKATCRCRAAAYPVQWQLPTCKGTK